MTIHAIAMRHLQRVLFDDSLSLHNFVNLLYINFGLDTKTRVGCVILIVVCFFSSTLLV